MTWRIHILHVHIHWNVLIGYTPGRRPYHFILFKHHLPWLYIFHISCIYCLMYLVSSSQYNYYCSACSTLFLQMTLYNSLRWPKHTWKTFQHESWISLVNIRKNFQLLWNQSNKCSLFGVSMLYLTDAKWLRIRFKVLYLCGFIVSPVWMSVLSTDCVV